MNNIHARIKIYIHANRHLPIDYIPTFLPILDIPVFFSWRHSNCESSVRKKICWFCTNKLSHDNDFVIWRNYSFKLSIFHKTRIWFSENRIVWRKILLKSNNHRFPSSTKYSWKIFAYFMFFSLSPQRIHPNDAAIPPKLMRHQNPHSATKPAKMKQTMESPKTLEQPDKWSHIQDRYLKHEDYLI